jgi:tetratricopeptide (TPR) repeat protein
LLSNVGDTLTLQTFWDTAEPLKQNRQTAIQFFALAGLALSLGLRTAAQAPPPQANGGSPKWSRDTDTGLLLPSRDGAPEPELEEARRELQKGSVTEAAQKVRRYLEKHPNSPDAHFLLGYILFVGLQSKPSPTVPAGATATSTETHARVKESLAEFTEGAKYRSPSASDLVIVALDYVLLSDLADADKWLTLSVKMNPTDVQAWYHLGRTKYTEGRLEEAKDAFHHSLELDAKNVKAQDNLALCLEGLGQIDDAMAAYRAAIDWNDAAGGKIPAPYVDFGSFLIDRNHPADALPYLVKATAISPQDARAHERLGAAYSRLDKLAEAQAEFEKAVQLAPDISSLHYVLGQIYRREGLNEKAKLEFDRVAELNGSHATPETPIP